MPYGYNMTKKYFPFKNYYWFFPFITAFAVRAFFFVFWLRSPYKFYHMIRGLDMYTLFTRYPNDSVTSYSIFLRIIDKLTQPFFFIETIVFVQLILGIVTCMFIVYICKCLTDSKRTACIAGLFYALYAPALMYEGFVLKDFLYLFFAVYILFLSFYTVSKKYSNLSVFLLGGGVLIAGFIRSLGTVLAIIIFCWFVFSLIRHVIKKKIASSEKIKICFRKLFLLFIGIFMMCSIVFAFNGNHFSYLYSVLFNYNYFTKVGMQKELKSINLADNDAKDTSTREIAIKGKMNIASENYRNGYMNCVKIYLRKLLLTFRAYENPNNLNYYFIRATLLPLKYLIGPILLFPLALSGFLVFLFKWKSYTHPELLVLFCIPIIIACVVFVPIGRYRIVIAPVLTITASVFICELIDCVFLKRFTMFALFFLIFAVFVFLESYFSNKNYLRASDYVAYGQALRYQNPKSSLILSCFEKAYDIRPDIDFIQNNLFLEYLRTGNFRGAEFFLRKKYRENPNDFDIVIRYVASLMGTKQYDKALRVLSSLEKPKDINRLKEYYFNWGEYFFFTENHRKALIYYNKLMNLMEPSQYKMYNYVNARIDMINLMEK
jgi:hypothetical protein